MEGFSSFDMMKRWAEMGE